MAQIRKRNTKPKLIKLDLGCGNNRQQGFIGVDIAKLPNVDQVVDLEKFPWPWKDESVEDTIWRLVLRILGGINTPVLT